MDHTVEVSNCCRSLVLCAVYSGICTALPRTGGRHVNIPARPRLSMTMWVNLTNPPVRAAQIYRHAQSFARACEHIHAHAECVSERRGSSVCDNAAGFCFDMSAADSVPDGTEPDVWNSMLLKNAPPMNTTCIFHGKALRLPSLNF